MFKMKDLVENIPGSILFGNPDTEWKKISIDSRTIKEGEIFFALKGKNFDGHQFITEAIKKDASAIVVEKSFYQNQEIQARGYSKPVLMVDDTLSALQLWAHYYHSTFKLLNICITGSNGKTTTKEMISHLLKNRYNVLKSKGNYNTEIGVPLTILNLDSNHDVLVIELAAQRTGEIRELTKIIKPDIALITNVFEAHIGLFENQDNIAKEKSEIILSLKDKGTAILNRDDIYYDYFEKSLNHHNDIISFGFNPEAHLRAINFEQDNERGFYFDLLFQGNKFPVFVPLIGRFNVYNVLAAFSAGIKMQIPINEMINSISDFNAPRMRMEYMLFNKDITLIQDYYNSNPTAVKEALNSISSISGGRFKIAVLGDMLELGEKSIEYHKEIGRIASIFSYDMIIGFGDYGKWIVEGAKEQEIKDKKIYSFTVGEKEKLTNKLIRDVPRNSIVLLKGSRNMQMEDIVKHWLEKEKIKEKAENE